MTNLLYRAANNKPSSINEEKRSIDVIMTTENPVKIYDFEHGMVNEVLLMSGAVIPATRQVPLIDSHKSGEISNILGSAQGINIVNNEMHATAYFAEKSSAEWSLVKEGHLTDVSIGYRIDPKESVYIAKDETGVISGREFTGPVLVRKKWYVKELSLVPIGADEAAKARNENINKEESNTMDEKLRKFLISRGMAADATESEAWAFLNSLEKKTEEKREEPKTDVEKVRQEATGAERERITEIDAVCARVADFGVTAEMRDGWIKNGVSIDAVNRKILEKIQEKAAAENVATRAPATIQADEQDKFRAAAEDSVLFRAGRTLVKPAAGYDELTGFSIVDIARKSLILEGHRDTGNPMQMLERAVMTSMFPTLLGNIANKSLWEGFTNANETWSQWVVTGSVSDFKTYTSARKSAFPDLELLPEGTPMNDAQPIEGKEEYAISTYGVAFPITFQAMKNDDLSAFSDVPMNMGEAASRKIGDIVYAVLTGNPTMGDNKALFIAAHGNLAASGAAPGETTIGAAVTAMKKQKDISAKQRLNIQPEFYIAPVALEVASETFFATTNYATADTATTRANIYAGKFKRIYEPRLDDSSATAWYMAAAKGKTVKVFFLDGQQTPTITRQQGSRVLGVEYFISHHAGAKAMDWVGLYKNAGA